eukprot:g4203.t1
MEDDLLAGEGGAEDSPLPGPAPGQRRRQIQNGFANRVGANRLQLDLDSDVNSEHQDQDDDRGEASASAAENHGVEHAEDIELEPPAVNENERGGGATANFKPALGPDDPKTGDDLISSVRFDIENMNATRNGAAELLGDAAETLAQYRLDDSEKGRGKGCQRRHEVEKPQARSLQREWIRRIQKNTGQLRKAKSASAAELREIVTYWLSNRLGVHPKHFEPDDLTDAIASNKRASLEKKWRKENDVKREFFNAADNARFAKLTCDKDRFMYIESIIGQSDATSTKKMQLLQRFLGFEDVVSHKTRFRFLTEKEAEAAAGVRVWEAGKYHGEQVDGDAVKRRKLLKLQNNEDRSAASVAAKKRIADDKRRLNAFRMAAERMERKAVRGYNLWKRLDMFTLLDVDIAPLANRSFLARDDLGQLRAHAATGQVLPKYHAPTHMLPDEDSRPFVCIRIGPDATEFMKSKFLASECVCVRAYEDYTLDIVQVNPKSLPHDGGNYSLVQDLYTMLGESVPLPGAVVAEWPSDPMVLYMGSPDCGSDVLLGFRKFRDICGGARAERDQVLSNPPIPKLQRGKPSRSANGVADNQQGRGLGQHLVEHDYFADEVDERQAAQDALIAKLMPNLQSSIDLTTVPLQVFFQQVICLSHQYHLLDGEVIDLVHDCYPDFVQKVKVVVKAQNQWGSVKVKTFADHRWQTLKQTLEGLLKHQAQVVYDIRSITVAEKQPELQATAKSAQEAVEDPRLFPFIRSLDVVLAATDACAEAIKKDVAEVWSNTKLPQMERAVPHYQVDLQKMIADFLETRGDLDRDAIAMMLTLAVRLPDRQKQFFTWPLLFNRFFSEDPSEVAQAAELLLSSDSEKRDPWLTWFIATRYRELSQLADHPTTELPWRVFKILAPLYVTNSGTAIWVEAAHSKINKYRKNAPSMRMEKAGVLHVLGQEPKLSFEQWKEVQQQWTAMHDKRTRTGKKHAREAQFLKDKINQNFGIKSGALAALPADEVVPVEPSDAESGGVVAMDVDEEEDGDVFGGSFRLADLDESDGVVGAHDPLSQNGGAAADDDEDDFDDETLLVHPLLERGLIMWDKHREEVAAEAGPLGGKVGQFGSMEIPDVVLNEAQVPEIAKKYPGKKTVLAQQGGQHTIALMSLVQKVAPPPPPSRPQPKQAAAKNSSGSSKFNIVAAKAALGKKKPAPKSSAATALVELLADEPVYVCYYKSKGKGFLLPCTKIDSTVASLGRAAPAGSVSYAVKLNKPTSFSAWATRPAITTKQPLTFRENSSCRFVWSKRWKSIVAVTTASEWQQRQVPRANLVTSSNQRAYGEDVVERDGASGHTRTRRDYEWKSVDQLVAVPELMLSEKLRRLSVSKRIYMIFRPEASTWTVSLKLKTKRVSRSGTPLDDPNNPEGKRFSATTDGRQLDKDSIATARRICLTKALNLLKMSHLPVVSSQKKMAPAHSQDLDKERLGVPTDEEMREFMDKISRGKLSNFQAVTDMMERRCLDTIAGSAKRITEAVLDMLGEHPFNILRLRSNKVKIIKEMKAGRFVNPNDIVVVRRSKMCLVLSGNHRVQALKDYRMENGNACQDIRMEFKVVVDDVNRWDQFVKLCIRVKNEGQTGLRTTMPEKIFDVFPRLEKEYEGHIADPANKSAKKFEFFKQRCESTNSEYEVREFLLAKSKWGEGSMEWVVYVRKWATASDETKYAAFLQKNLKKLRLEQLGEVCRDLCLCSIFQAWCGSTRSDGDVLPKGLGNRLSDDFDLLEAMRELIKQGYKPKEKATSDFHKCFVHVTAEMVRNCMGGQKVADNVRGVDMTSITDNEQTVIGNSPEEVGLDYNKKWPFSKAVSTARKAEQTKLNKIGQLLLTSSQFMQMSGVDGTFTVVKKGSALATTIGLAKGIYCIMEGNKGAICGKMHGEQCKIVGLALSDEVQEAKNLANLETARFNNIKKRLEKEFETEKAALWKAGKTKKAQAKKCGEGDADDRAEKTKKLEEELAAKLVAEKTKHEEEAEKYTEMEKDARKLESWEICLTELEGIPGVESPVVESAQLRVDASHYKVVDTSAIGERFSVTGDDLTKMKVLACRLPLEIKMDDDEHPEKELLESVDLLFKPSQTFKGEVMYFEPKELKDPGITIKYKCPTSFQMLPEEIEKRKKAKAQAAGGAASSSTSKANKKSPVKVKQDQEELLNALKTYNAQRKIAMSGQHVTIAEELQGKDELTAADKKKVQKQVCDAAEALQVDNQALLRTLQGQQAEITTSGKTKHVDVTKHEFQAQKLDASSSSTAKAKAPVICLSGLPGNLEKLHEEVKKRSVVDLVNPNGTEDNDEGGTPAKRSRTGSPPKFCANFF